MTISSRMSPSSSTTSTRFTFGSVAFNLGSVNDCFDEMLFLRMPSFADWLRASWGDFRRRWSVLLAVAGTGGAATLAAGFLPFIPAALATLLGVGPAWAVWVSAAVV